MDVYVLLIDIAKTYIFLSIVALVLIFLRDDREIILTDLKKGFERNFFIAIIHGFFMTCILPLSIPFSLGRIISKWF
jgi:hypothetical protein